MIVAEIRRQSIRTIVVAETRPAPVRTTARRRAVMGISLVAVRATTRWGITARGAPPVATAHADNKVSTEAARTAAAAVILQLREAAAGATPRPAGAAEETVPQQEAAGALARALRRVPAEDDANVVLISSVVQQWTHAQHLSGRIP